MIILSYDISDNKLRSRFSKYISKFGHRIQYSVFEIDNSERVLENILMKIDEKFGEDFDERDSVLIFKVKNEKINVIKYGFVRHEDQDVIII